MRAFIGIKLDDCKDEIIDIVKSLKEKNQEARYVRFENLHLTLNFLGEIDLRDISLIEDAFSSLSYQPFDVEMIAVETFRNMAILNVSKSKELMNLQLELKNKLFAKGFELDRRKYFPHITLARKFNDVIRKKIKIVTKVEEIVLFSSEVINNKLTYTPILSKKLGDIDILEELK